MKYGLNDPGTDVVTVSVHDAATVQQTFDDLGCCWLVIVDEGGVYPRYVCYYRRETTADGFEVFKTLIGDRNLVVNPRYLVRTEEVRAWQWTATRRRAEGETQTVTGHVITHPRVQDIVAKGYRCGRTAEDVFKAIPEADDFNGHEVRD